MSIDVNGVSSTQIPARVGGSADEAKAAEQKPATDTGQSSAADTVSLSDNAKQLGQIESKVSSSPVVDTQRVEAVKQAISEGSFEIDPAKIADKLMQFESMLKAEA